jgi:hypothetical protein
VQAEVRGCHLAISAGMLSPRKEMMKMAATSLARWPEGPARSGRG